jgi:hypothetical protein
MTIVAIDAGRVRMMPPDGRADADVGRIVDRDVACREGRASAPNMDIRRIGAPCPRTGRVQAGFSAEIRPPGRW